MAAITAQMVKDLREKTGAGMMDCKAALNETGGDMETAVDWLRAKGLSKAAKKADRVAAEGLICVALAKKAGAVAEVNSETDFVARNEQFQSMVKEIAQLALKAKGDLDKLSAAEDVERQVGHRPCPGDGGHDRREHEPAPRRLSGGARGRRRQLCP